MKEYILPVNIPDSHLALQVQNLYIKKPMQIGLSEPVTTLFEKGSHIILDFGKEMCGGIRLLTYHAGGVPVRIRFGESLSESCSELHTAQNATNDHALRDFTVELVDYSDMTFGNTGFRFVRLDFDGNVELKSILAVNHILSKKPIFRYEGPDARIRQIYETAKRTVDLCASSGFVWDGVKRDRLVWIGDMHPEMLALTTLYGRLPTIERSLDFVKDQTPLPGWMNGYPMYSMWWIIILADYYEKTQAGAFVQKQLPYLEKLLQQMLGCVKEDGTMEYPFFFVDWPTFQKPDAVHGARAINILAAKKAIRLLQLFRKDTTKAEQLLERLRKVEILPQTSKQVTGLKYFAAELTEADRQRLVAGGAKGMSTFMSYYILKAVASFDKDAAISMMKEYYGAMLDKGATTFWEDFDITWAENSCRIDAFPEPGQRDIHGDFGAYCYVGFRHSLCHGWSAGVLQFSQEECC